MRSLIIALLAAATIAVPRALELRAQGREGAQPGPQAAAPDTKKAPAGPFTRTAWDGKPNFAGVWHLPMQVDRDPERGQFNLGALERLYRPETRTLRDKLRGFDSPDYHCAPQAYPMAMTVPHPIQIVQAPNVFVVLTEYMNGFRVVPTDGRPHDPAAKPSHVGESVGHWEGDTLVVDVTRFNGKQWLALALQGAAGRAGGAAPARGAAPAGGPPPSSELAGLRGARENIWPSSDALQVVERWTMVDAATMEYQAVVNDPKMLTDPWTSARVRRTKLPYNVIQEDVCVSDVQRELESKLEREK